MSSLHPVQSPSSTQRYIALGLSVVTLLCALLYWLIYAFVAAQAYAGVYNGPLLLMIGTIVTLPPAFVCTGIAMILVGWPRSKLAWILLSSFAWPYIALFVYMIWSEVRSLFI